MPAHAAPLDALTFRRDRVRLHAVAAGPEDGPLVLLLHGFPEFWYGWHRQIGPLAAAGFRVVVPDQRGYNRSDKPSGIGAYSLAQTTADAIAIADQLGRRRVCVAGHDWGAHVAWSMALHRPDRVARLAILNVPHPAVFSRHLLTDPRQLLRSWYMFFFQLPRLPEAALRARDYAVATAMLTGTSHPGTFSGADLARYRAAWSQPGALTGMVHWYRALFRVPPRFPRQQVDVPTRIIWGERDAFLRREMAQESLRYCPDGELIRLPEATHWLQHEEPERVSELLVEFFRPALAVRRPEELALAGRH